MTDNGRTTSVWMATAAMPEAPALGSDERADVCIVGAGIAGLTTAYLLAREGKRVVVVDDGPTAGGETCRTTAHLVSAVDDRFYHLERLHGAEGARVAAQSHAAAIDRIERIVRDEKIDCDFLRLDGFLFVPPGDDLGQLDAELQAAHRAGLSDVSRVDRAPRPDRPTTRRRASAVCRAGRGSAAFEFQWSGQVMEPVDVAEAVRQGEPQRRRAVRRPRDARRGRRRVGDTSRGGGDSAPRRRQARGLP